MSSKTLVSHIHCTNNRYLPNNAQPMHHTHLMHIKTETDMLTSCQLVLISIKLLMSYNASA